MSAFGENLRREREMRGVSLAEISQATKIGARMLDAIETERFERLPGGVFNAAFVRQYARYLGLDEDRAVAEFGAACGTSLVKDTQQKDAANAALRQMVASESATYQLRSLPFLLAVAILALGLAGFWGWRLWRSAHPPTVSAPPAVIAKAPPPPVTAVQDPLPPAATKGLDLELEARDRCNIQVSLDGRDTWDAVMRRGSHRNLKADHTVKLTVDNAAALRVTRNGEVLPALGGRNEAQTVTFKAQ
jgi:transcriptional regulator with XRE-family HTH domain